MLARTNRDMAMVMNWAYRVLQSSFQPGQAPSIGLFCMNPESGELEHAGVGRVSMLIYRADNKSLDHSVMDSAVRDSQGTVSFVARREHIKSGDVVVFNTGSIPSPDALEYHSVSETLGRIVVRAADTDAIDILAQIRAELSGSSEAAVQKTDQTVLVMKRE